MLLPVCSLLLDCAGMGWDLEALPAQETCEPAKYGGASSAVILISAVIEELQYLLPHTLLLLGRLVDLHTACY